MSDVAQSDTLDVPVRSREDFRRALAGLVDPDRKIQAIESNWFRPAAAMVIVCLCKHFGDDLDRKTMWSRIASGMTAACAKVSTGDLDQWLDCLLEHIRADAARVACCDMLTKIRNQLSLPDEAARKAFVRYIETHPYAVITFGKAEWTAYKEGQKNSKSTEETVDHD